jgi:hypothetical protein
MARFVVEVIAGLDLRVMTGSYRGSREASYYPQLPRILITAWGGFGDVLPLLTIARHL